MNKIDLYKNFYFSVILCSIVIAVFLMPSRFEDFDGNRNFIFSCIAFINVLLAFYVQSKIYKSLIRIDTFFLIGFLIVHFQIPFLASIGIEPDRPNFVWINQQVVNYATWLSLISLLLWLLGYFISFSKFKVLKSPNNNFYFKTKTLDKIMFTSFVFFIVLVGKAFLGGSYAGANNWGAGASYAFVIMKVTLYLRVIYFFNNTKNTNFNLSLLFSNKLFLLVFVGYFLLFMLVGDRGPILQLGVLYLACYSLYRKPIGSIKLIMISIIGIFFLVVLSLGRTSDNSSRNSNILETGINNLSENEEDFFNPTGELAISNRILYRALDVVPNKHPYLYGLPYSLEMVGIIPFASSFFIALTGIPEMYRATSAFFTILGQGKNYTYGEGSEIIADIYVNFGVIGVFALIFLFGYFVSSIQINVYKTINITYVIIFSFVIIDALYINRANVLQPIKSLVYALILNKFLTNNSKLNES